MTQMIGCRGAASGSREAGPAAALQVSVSVTSVCQCPASGSIHWQVGIGPAPPSGGRTKKLQVPGLF